MKGHSFEGTLRMIQLEDGGEEFSLENKEGRLRQTRYLVFSGIALIYNDIHLPRCAADTSDKKRKVLEIDYCREGRMECQVKEKFFYLGKEDIAMHYLGDEVREENFPTSHYHGITIQIDLEEAPENLEELLPGVRVEPRRLADKFRLEERFFFALRKFPSIQHIFSELYEAPATCKTGYMKLKTLEILLFLHGIEPERTKTEQYSFSATQVELAKQISCYLNERLGEEITAAVLCEHFSVSNYQLRNCFLNVYGMTVAEYCRSQRMQRAAKLLKETDLPILEIACRVGYDNSSKFSKVFSEVIGVLPSRYRNVRYRQTEHS